MSFSPCRRWRDTTSSASRAAGFFSISWTRVATSHAGRAGEHGVDVDPLQRGGHQAHGRELARAPADPVPHGKPREPAFGDRRLVQLGAGPVTATACWAKSSPAALYASAAASMPLRVSGVPPLLLMTTQSVSLRASRPSRANSRAMPSGSVLSRKWTAILSAARVAQGVGDELRPERRAADSDRQHACERVRVRRLDRAADARPRRTPSRPPACRESRLGARASARVRRRGASNGRPSAFRRGWRSRLFRARPSPRRRRSIAGAIRSRNASSNCIRLTSSVRPTASTRQK